MARMSNRERTVAYCNGKAEAKALALREQLVQHVPRDHSYDMDGFKATPDNLKRNVHTQGFTLGQRKVTQERDPAKCILTDGDLYDMDKI